MSFDLYMHRPSGSPPLAVAEMDQVVTALPCFHRQYEADAPVYYYENPVTGVYFTLYFDELADGDVEDTNPGIEFQSPFLSVNLNYIRPTFFALEAMPIAVDIARSLHLQLLDTQGPSGSTVVCSHADELIESWCRNNECAVRAFLADGARSIGEGSLQAVGTREQMTYWWRYARLKNGLEEALEAEDVFVPQIALLRANGSTAVERLVCWPDCILALIPETELLLIRRQKRRLLGFGRRSEGGVVKFSEIADILGTDLVRATEPVPHYIYRQHESSQDVTKANAGLHMVRLDRYERLMPDSIVDVDNLGYRHAETDSR